MLWREVTCFNLLEPSTLLVTLYINARYIVLTPFLAHHRNFNLHINRILGFFAVFQLLRFRLPANFFSFVCSC